MLKQHTVTLCHVIAVFNYMFDDMNGMMGALTEKKTK